VSFTQYQPPEELRAGMGNWIVSIVPKGGIRLTTGTHFHLDEGPDFVYLSLYRVAANRRQIDVVRNRDGTAGIESGDGVVNWSPIDDNLAQMSVRYHIIEEEAAIEATFEVRPQRDYSKYELFISSYFTPYHTPRFAVADTRVDPDGPVRWYESKWYSEYNVEAWPRDAASRETFADGRWLTSPSQNWVMGPDYALPLMTQRHRHAGAIVLMARPEDCIGLSGYNSFHNSQYVHLFGRDVKAGDLLTSTVRMEVVGNDALELDTLDDLAVDRYQAWVE
jgi:hypothetical protein